MDEKGKGGNVTTIKSVMHKTGIYREKGAQLLLPHYLYQNTEKWITLKGKFKNYNILHIKIH